MQKSFFMKTSKKQRSFKPSFLKAQYSAAAERLSEMGGSMRSSGPDLSEKLVEIK